VRIFKAAEEVDGYGAIASVYAFVDRDVMATSVLINIKKKIRSKAIDRKSDIQGILPL